MTSPDFIPDLRRDEGCRLKAYPDALSGGAPWTIGSGHTGPEVHAGLTWTADQAREALEADVGRVRGALNIRIPWWTKLQPYRADVLANMAFNLGVEGLLRFDTFLAFVKAGEYQHAALDMLGTEWARQLPNRAHRLSRQMATGEHQP